ncbi:MAG: hypothetical protein ABIJ46_00365 [bacterium]
MELLWSATTAAERQEVVDRLFTEERRGERLEEADRDPQGRPVRYFRYIGFDTFLRFLESGRHDRNSVDEETAEDRKNRPEDSIRRICEGVLEHRAAQRGDFETDWYEECRDVDRAISLAFPDEADRLVASIHVGDYGSLREFIGRSVPKRLQHVIYGGGLDRRFIPLVALSAGGPIRQHLHDGQVYMELVIPTDRMQFRKEDEGYCEGEKEVFVKELEVDDIVSVVMDSEALLERFVEAEDSNVRLHADEQNNKKLFDVVERWRWDTKIDDYLPVGARLSDK